MYYYSSQIELYINILYRGHTMHSFIVSAVSVYGRRHSAYYVICHRKAKCRAGKAGNLPAGLFDGATINMQCLLVL